MILQRIHWRLEEMLLVDVSVEEEHLFDTAEDIASGSSLILEPCPPILLLSRDRVQLQVLQTLSGGGQRQGNCWAA